jgi:hypothetical protein
MSRNTTLLIVIVLSGVAVQCGRIEESLTGPTQGAPGSATPQVTFPAAEFMPPATFVGAGDIALCTAAGNHHATAALLDSIPGTVFALGDNAYMSGTLQEYNDCYDRSWGRHRSRTRPVPGNHEYETAGASGYFDYFGSSAGPSGLGHYSFDLGGWHIVALNSNIPVSAASAQGAWLRADLSGNPARCTLAYWHHPRFSSGRHGNDDRMRDFWRILYEAGAEVVLAAHDHTYERFAPQDHDGGRDDARGIRQFVAGTGGASLYPFPIARPNSEARVSAHGVLKLTLRPGGYDWEFVTVSGTSDFGTGTCH